MTNRARTVAITGAASGIGRAAADHLRAKGCRIIGVDRADADVRADLSTQDGRIAAARGIAELAPDGLDALITSAGIGGEGASGRMVSAINFFGTTRLAVLLRPQLEKGRDPRVVVISSSTSVLPYDPELLALYLSDDEEGAVAHTDDHMVAYCTGKRALCHWVRRNAVSADWAGSGILLNGVAPGLIVTPLTAGSFDTDEGRALLSQATPIALPNYPPAQAIAPLIGLLASAENGNMVGQIVYSDGGSDVLLRGEAVP